jgi:hypothetical protein
VLRTGREKKSGQTISPSRQASEQVLLKNLLFRNVFDIPAAAGWQFDLNSPLRNSDQELCAFVCSVRDKKSFDHFCHQTVVRRKATHGRITKEATARPAKRTVKITGTAATSHFDEVGIAGRHGLD